MNQTVVRRPGDPYIYLYVKGEWYCYDPEEKPLGKGAMGDVFLGYRCNDDTQVAIKRVKDMYANNPMIRSRALQEASLTFRHNNLVEMIGICEAEPDRGPIFLVSKYVRGENINAYIEKLTDSPYRIEKICNIICSVLDALQYLHARGVTHRDIKPSNIMIEMDSNVRLMDLGIARMNGGNKFSQYGFIGTPQYSAPEQIRRRRSGDVGARESDLIGPVTDLYALGITFYELLTGTNPMDCDTQVETLAKQLTETLPAHVAIPTKMMKVIWKATEKNASNRYQSATEFQQAIRDALVPDPPAWQRILDEVKRFFSNLFGSNDSLTYNSSYNSNPNANGTQANY